MHRLLPLLLLLLSSAAATAPNPLIEQGRQLLLKQLSYFTHPERYLDPKDTYRDTTPEEDLSLSKAAMRLLSTSGKNGANAMHVADLLAFVKEISPVVQEAGISPIRLVRMVLIHDLGKEYKELPEAMRVFLESIFPPTKDVDQGPFYLQRVILGHEFGSMLLTEKLARSEKISEPKIERLKALIARHSAGYDPELPGSHFWVQPFAWPSFAKTLKSHGVALPERYEPLLDLLKGGAPDQIVFTALDRAVSLTLASQEKFAAFLLNTDKWNNEALAVQCEENAKNVMLEVKNILAKLRSQDGAKEAAYRKVEQSIEAAFSTDRERLYQLAQWLPLMGRAEGRFKDRPATSLAELSSSLVYKNKSDTWFRVTQSGQLLRGNAGKWVLVKAPKTKQEEKLGATTVLFRDVIYEDFGYTPRYLDSRNESSIP